MSQPRTNDQLLMDLRNFNEHHTTGVARIHLQQLVDRVESRFLTIEADVLRARDRLNIVLSE